MKKTSSTCKEASIALFEALVIAHLSDIPKGLSYTLQGIEDSR